VHTSGTGAHPRGRHLLTAAGDRARTPGPSPRVPEVLATGLRLPAGPARRATLRSTWRSSPSATRGTPLTYRPAFRADPDRSRYQSTTHGNVLPWSR
jgi:hypothetical protein